MSALDGIKARLQAATPGPWKAWNRGIGYEVHGEYDEPINVGHRETFTKGDAELIAHAPTDLARLVAAVEAVERTAKYLDTLAPGDQHYANLFRQAVATALEGTL